MSLKFALEVYPDILVREQQKMLKQMKLLTSEKNLNEIKSLTSGLNVKILVKVTSLAASVAVTLCEEKQQGVTTQNSKTNSQGEVCDNFTIVALGPFYDSGNGDR